MKFIFYVRHKQIQKITGSHITHLFTINDNTGINNFIAPKRQSCYLYDNPEENLSDDSFITLLNKGKVLSDREEIKKWLWLFRYRIFNEEIKNLQIIKKSQNVLITNNYIQSIGVPSDDFIYNDCIYIGRIGQRDQIACDEIQKLLPSETDYITFDSGKCEKLRIDYAKLLETSHNEIIAEARSIYSNIDQKLKVSIRRMLLNLQTNIKDILPKHLHYLLTYDKKELGRFTETQSRYDAFRGFLGSHYSRLYKYFEGVDTSLYSDIDTA